MRQICRQIFFVTFILVNRCYNEILHFFTARISVAVKVPNFHSDILIYFFAHSIFSFLDLAARMFASISFSSLYLFSSHFRVCLSLFLFLFWLVCLHLSLVLLSPSFSLSFTQRLPINQCINCLSISEFLLYIFKSSFHSKIIFISGCHKLSFHLQLTGQWQFTLVIN